MRIPEQLRQLTRALVAGLFLLSMVGTQSALADTFYVSFDGNDTWDGSNPGFQGGNVGPFRTIGQALTAAAGTTGSDTIIVEAATYNTEASPLVINTPVTMQVRQKGVATRVTVASALTISPGANNTVSMSGGDGDFSFTGTALNLTSGTLNLGANILRLASGTTITRTGGAISGSAPVHGTNTTLTYNAGAATTTAAGLEVPANLGTGGINVQSGTVTFSQNITLGASFSLTAGASATSSGTLTLGEGANIDNPGTGSFTATGAVNFTNTANGGVRVANTSTGTMTFASLNFTAAADINTDNFINNASTGTITINGTTTAINNDATTTVVGDGVMGIVVRNNGGTFNLGPATLGNRTTTAPPAITQITNAAGGTLNMTGNVSAAGNVTNAGTMNINGNTLTLSRAAAFAQLGTINGTAGTVTLTGNGATMGNNAVTIAGNLTLAPTGTGAAQTINNGGAVAVGGSLNVSTGTITNNNAAMTVAGSTTTAAGTTLNLGGASFNTGGGVTVGGTVTQTGAAVTVGSLSLSSGSTYTLNNNTLNIDTNFADNGGTFTAGATSTLNFQNDDGDFGATSAAAGSYTAGPNQTLGNLTVNKNGQTLTVNQSVDVAGNFVITAGTVDLGDDTIRLTGNTSAANIASGGITTSTTGGVVFAGGAASTQAINGPGTFSNIVIGTNAAAPVNVASAAAFTGKLSINSGGLTSGANLSASGTNAEVLVNAADASASVAGGFNGAAGAPDYKLTYFGTATAARAVGGEYTAGGISDLTFSNTGANAITTNLAATISGNMAVNSTSNVAQGQATTVQGALSVGAGSNVTGGGAFTLSGNSQTHTITGTIAQATTVTGDTVVMNGSAANDTGAGGVTSEIGALIVGTATDAGSLTVSNIHEINGDVTVVNVASTLSVSLDQEAGTGDVADNDGTINGNVVLGGASFTLGANATVTGNVDHNTGVMALGSSNLSLSGGASTFDGATGATPGVSYTAGTGAVVITTGQSFGINGGSIPNLTVNGNATISSNSSVTGTLDVNGATTVSLGGSDLTVSNNVTLDGGVVFDAAAVGTASGELIVAGTTLTAGGNVSVENLTINSDGSANFRTDDTTAPISYRTFSVTGAYTHTKGAVDLDGNNLEINDTANTGASFTYAAGTYAATTGAVSFNDDNDGAPIAVNTGDANVSIPNLDVRIAGGNAADANDGLAMGASDGFTVTSSLSLEGGTIDLTTANPDGSLTIGNGVNITRDQGAILGTPTIGTGTNVTYDGAVTVGTELSTAVNNLTVNAAITNGTSTTVSGTFDVNAAVDLTTPTPDGSVTLADGATIAVSANGALNAAVVPTGTNNITVDGNVTTDDNFWPSSMTIGTLTVGSTGTANLVLNMGAEDRTVQGNVAFVNGGSINLNNRTVNFQGNVGSVAGVTNGTLLLSGSNAQTLGGGTSSVGITINKTNNSDTVTLTGNLNMAGATGPPVITAQTLTLTNGLLVTGSNSVTLNHGVTGAQPNQGFTRGSGHIVGNVTKSLTASGANSVLLSNVQFPTGTTTPRYRPLTLYFPSGLPATVNMTVAHVASSPGGTNDGTDDGKFSIDAGAAGNITSYPAFHWRLTPDIGITPTQTFDVTVVGTGQGLGVGEQIQDVRLIRRIDGGSTANPWLLQGGSYDNALDGNGDPTVTVRNALGGIQTQSILVTIGQKNSAPTITSSAGATATVAQNNTFTSTFTATDPDINDTPTLSLEVGGSYSGLTFDASTGVVTWAVGFDTAPGTYPVTVKATDTNGASSSTTTTVTVTKTNRGPVFTAELTDQTIKADQSSPFTFTFAATDADQDAVTYALVAGSAGAIDATTGVFTYSPTFADAGSTVTVQVNATDGTATTASSTATLTINHAYGLCDVDQDNACTALDASQVLQFAAGSTTLSDQQKWAGDVSGASGVTAFDASLILQFDANLISTFPAGAALSGKQAPAMPVARGEIAWGEMQWNEGTTLANVPLAVDAVAGVGVENVYAVTMKVNLDLEAAKLAKVVTNLPEDWMVTHNLNEETGVLTIVMAGATPISAAGSLAELQLQMTDEMAQMNIVGEGALNEDAMLALSDLSVRQIPTEYALDQNYPNPFNPTTQIMYSLPEAAHVTLEVYDVTGRLVQTLINKEQDAGRYGIQWDGRNIAGESVASGLYLYRVRAGSFVQVKTMMLVK